MARSEIKTGPQYVIIRKNDAYVTGGNKWIHVHSPSRLIEYTLRQLDTGSVIEISYDEFIVQITLGVIPTDNNAYNFEPFTVDIITPHDRFFVSAEEW